jgi:hypothetical protein
MWWRWRIIEFLAIRASKSSTIECDCWFCVLAQGVKNPSDGGCIFSWIHWKVVSSNLPKRFQISRRMVKSDLGKECRMFYVSLSCVEVSLFQWNDLCVFVHSNIFLSPLPTHRWADRLRAQYMTSSQPNLTKPKLEYKVDPKVPGWNCKVEGCHEGSPRELNGFCQKLLLTKVDPFFSR